MQRSEVRSRLDLIEADLAREQQKADRQISHINYRLRMLPKQLDSARRRVVHLEREAARLGLSHLLSDGGSAQ
jgi:hypothetical protein